MLATRATARPRRSAFGSMWPARSGDCRRRSSGPSGAARRSNRRSAISRASTGWAAMTWPARRGMRQRGAGHRRRQLPPAAAVVGLFCGLSCGAARTRSEPLTSPSNRLSGVPHGRLVQSTISEIVFTKDVRGLWRVESRSQSSANAFLHSQRPEADFRISSRTCHWSPSR
jgi:hypothetical protein